MLLLALLAPWAANGQSTLTVCDGTSTSSYAPIKGSGGSQTEFVYPASMLEEMEGGTITSVKFFSSSTATTNYTNTVTVYVEEVEGTTESTSAWLYSQSTATMVYEGTTLSVSDGELVITFSTPFVYNGGNLCFNIWSASSTPSVSYYCVTSTSACAYDYYITPPVSTPYSTASSLPKVEFTYTPSTTSCEKPETLEATNITTNTALLVWGGASGTFNVEYKKSTETDYSVFASNVGQNVLLYNLDPATTYNVRVQRVCGGEVSSWKNTTFSTACGVINTFPVSYGFETSEGFPTGVSSYSAPTTNNLGNCWRNEATSQTGSSAARLWCTGTSSHSGSQSLMLPDKNNFNTTMLVFPAMNFTSANGYIVTFWISRNATGSNPEGFKVYASDCDTIGANAVELGHYSRNYNIAYPQIESSAGWYYYETDPIMMTGTTYIIFEGQSYYGNATYVDDVTIKIAPTCFIPTEAHAEVLDANNATISWTPDPLNAAGGSYSILDAEHNVVPGADQLTGTSFSLSGLNPETEYTYYVRTNCSNSEENVDLVEVAFSTPADCAAPVLGDDAFTNVSAHQATVSWTGFSSNTAYIVRYRTAEYLDGITEDFNETSSLPTGWAQYTAVLDNVLAGTATLSSGSSWSRTSTGLGAYNWKINVWNTKNAWMVTPSVTVPANGTLSFDVALTAYNGDGAPSSSNMPTANSRFVVLVSNSDLATWTILREWNNTGSSDVLNDISNTGNTFSVDLSAYENDNVRVAFYIEHSGSGDSDFHLDNVAIGTTIPAGIWQTVSPNPTTTSTTLTDLTAETPYDVKVNGICTGTQEETGSAIQSFTTTIACPKPNTLIVAANAVDPTTKENLTWVMTGAETDWQISCLNGAVENIIDINESEVSINPTTHEVSYTLSGLIPGQVYTVKVRANCEASVPGDQTSDWSNTQNIQTEATCVEPTAFDHGTVDAHNAPLSWTEAGTATQWQICINDDMDNLILISNTTAGVTVEGQNVSYTLTGLTAETAYTVELRAYCDDGDGNQSPWVTTSFTTLVACPAPTNLQVEANALDATFSWEGEAGSYEVVTSINSSDNPSDLVSTSVTGNNYNFTNLELGNHYFWVRSNCSANGEGYSTWAGPASVHIGYCEPNPSGRDGKGITKVQFGMGSDVVNNVDETNGLPSTSPYYGDYSAMIGAVQAGVESTVSITYATGSNTVYSYGTIIWIDFNNDMEFSDDEIVYTGTSTEGSGGVPQVLDATITIPATQATGDYRMRIAGADSYFDSYIGGSTSANHSACFSSNYSVCHDYTLRVLEAPSCLTPTNVEVTYTGGTTATIGWTGDAEAWNMRVNGVDVNGVITNPYTLTGLELATTYSVEVQANCGANGTSEWSTPVNFTTDFCLPENMCEITFELTDTYGDSWNGNYISVVDVLTNTEFAQLTNEDLNGTDGYGENELNTINLPVCDGREIQFQYHIGVGSTYPEENSWVIKDVNDEIIWEGQGSDGGDHNYTVSCALNPSFTKSIDANSWYAISSPVNTPAVADVEHLTDDNYDFYRYDEASATWENYKAGHSDFTTFENGRGYIYRNSTGNDLTFTGVPNNSVSYTLKAERADDLKGFNLLGNPYTTDYNYSGVCYNLTEKGTWKVNATSYTIPVCEAVLVKVSSEVNYPYLSTKSAPKAVEALAFTVSGNGYEDVTYAMLEDGKGLNKVAHLAEDAPALSIPVDGSNYAIAYLGYEVESFPLTLNAQAGEYTIALNNQISGLSYCHLLDKETGKETDLLKGAYTFKANGNSDRFTVLLNASLENGEIAIWNGNSWIVNGEGTLQVFDVMGRRVYNQEVAGQSSLNTDELATGVYVIRLGEKSQKIVVK